MTEYQKFCAAARALLRPSKVSPPAGGNVIRFPAHAAGRSVGRPRPADHSLAVVEAANVYSFPGGLSRSEARVLLVLVPRLQERDRAELLRRLGL